MPSFSGCIRHDQSVKRPAAHHLPHYFKQKQQNVKQNKRILNQQNPRIKTKTQITISKLPNKFNQFYLKKKHVSNSL